MHYTIYSIISGLVIIHEHLFQLMTADSTQESLEKLTKEVVANFHTNVFEHLKRAVEKHRWWWKSKERIIDDLFKLVIKHKMVGQNAKLSGRNHSSQSSLLNVQPIPGSSS